MTFYCAYFICVACATAFCKAEPVLEFMCEVLDVKNVSEIRKVLSDSQRNKLAKELKGVKIEVIHCGQIRRKYKVFGLTKRPAQMQW